MNIRRKFLAACVAGLAVAGSVQSAEAQTIIRGNYLQLTDITTGNYLQLRPPVGLPGNQILTFPELSAPSSFLMSTSDNGQTLEGGLTLSDGLLWSLSLFGGSATNSTLTLAGSSNAGPNTDAVNIVTNNATRVAVGVANTTISNTLVATGGATLDGSTVTIGATGATTTTIGNDNSDAFAVNSSGFNLTTGGVITTATWQGEVIQDTYVADDLTIDGGTVNNTVIGGTGAAAGTFTTLTAGSLDLTDPLAVSDGGTGLSTVAQNAVVFGNGTSALGVVTNNPDDGTTKVLAQTNASGAQAPVWTDAATLLSGNFIINATSAQSADFNVTGTGVIGTSLSTPLVTGSAPIQIFPALNGGGAGYNVNVYGGVGTTDGGNVAILGGGGINDGGNVTITGGSGIADGGNVSITGGSGAVTGNVTITGEDVILGGFGAGIVRTDAGGVLSSSALVDSDIPDNLTIDGGTIVNSSIDNTVIGATTPAMGFFEDIVTEYIDAEELMLIEPLAASEGGTGLEATVIEDGQLLIGDGTTDSYNLATLTGTANRLSVVNGASSITLNIDPAYVGQSSITTVGTITSGTWQGDAIALAQGGTGVDNSTGIAQNAVFSGPVSGGAGAASFRALDDADIPGTLTITGGTIDGTVIGGTNPTSGTFSTLNVISDVTLGDDPANSIILNGTVRSNILFRSGSKSIGFQDVAGESLTISAGNNLGAGTPGNLDLRPGSNGSGDYGTVSIAGLGGNVTLGNASSTVTVPGTLVVGNFGLNSPLSITNSTDNSPAVSGSNTFANGAGETALGGSLSSTGTGAGANVALALTASGGTEGNYELQATDGTLNVDGGMVVEGSTSIDGTLLVTGGSTLNGIDNSNDGITNAGAITGATNLTASGTVTLTGLAASLPVKTNASNELVAAAIDLSTAEVTGTLPAASVGNGLTNTQVDNDLTIVGGTVDDTPIGALTPNTGSFTTLETSGTITAASLSTGGVVKSNAFGVLSNGSVTNAEVDDNLTIDGGTINNSPITNSSITGSSGSFTSLDASGNVTLGTDNTNTIALNGSVSSISFTDNLKVIGFTNNSVITGSNLIIAGQGAIGSQGNTYLRGGANGPNHGEVFIADEGGNVTIGDGLSTVSIPGTLTVGSFALGSTLAITNSTDNSPAVSGSNTFANGAGETALGGSLSSTGAGAGTNVALTLTASGGTEGNYELQATDGTLDIDGNTTINGTLFVSGSSTLNGIDNSNDGITNAGAITGVTDVTAGGTVTLTGLTTNLPVKTNGSNELVTAAISLNTGEVTGALPLVHGGTGVDNTTGIAQNAVFSGPVSGGAGAASFRALEDADIPGTLTITGGTIDGTVIGGTSPTSGTFGTLAALSDVTLGDDPANSIILNGTVRSNILFRSGSKSIGFQDLVGESLTIGAGNNTPSNTPGNLYLQPGHDNGGVFGTVSIANLGGDVTIGDVSTTVTLVGTLDVGTLNVDNLNLTSIDITNSTSNDPTVSGNNTFANSPGQDAIGGLFTATGSGNGANVALMLDAANAAEGSYEIGTLDGELNVRSTLVANNAISIDRGAGDIARIEANLVSGGQTYQLPATGGTLLTSGSGVELQATSPGTPQTGNLNIDGTAIVSTAVSTARLMNNAVLNIKPQPNGAGAGYAVTIGGGNGTVAGGDVVISGGSGTAMGNVSIEGGTASLTAAEGVATIDAATGVSITSASGNVFLEAQSGDGSLQATGAVNVSSVGSGAVTVSSTDGATSVIASGGTATLESTDANAIVRGNTGVGITATTGNATLTATASVASVSGTSATLTATSGSVGVSAASGTVNLNTTSGNVTIGNTGGDVTIDGNVRGAGSGSFGSESNRFAERYLLSGGADFEVIDNSLVTANSVIVANLVTDVGAVIEAVEPAIGGGSFTVYFTADPGAVEISYIIVNP